MLLLSHILEQHLVPLPSVLSPLLYPQPIPLGLEQSIHTVTTLPCTAMQYPTGPLCISQSALRPQFTPPPFLRPPGSPHLPLLLHEPCCCRWICSALAWCCGRLQHRRCPAEASCVRPGCPPNALRSWKTSSQLASALSLQTDQLQYRLTRSSLRLCIYLNPRPMTFLWMMHDKLPSQTS